MSAKAGDVHPITLKTEGIKTLKQLIQAMKDAAGDRLPATVKVRDFYKAFAAAFVEHAQEAMRQGIKIPQKIVDRLPGTRKVVIPILVAIPIWGVTFLVPLAFFFETMLVSLGIMWWFISSELKERAMRRRTA